MRVGLELTGLELDASGSARAITALRDELGRRPELELATLAQPGAPEDGRRGVGSRLRRGLARELLYLPVALPRRARRLGLDVLHCPVPLAPPRSRVPVVVTAHDAIAWDRPEWLTRANALHGRMVVGPILRRAAAVLTPSEHARTRLVARANLDPERVHVAPWGMDPRFSPGPRPDAVLGRLGVPGPYLLTVGTLQPRKNVEALVRAFEALAGNGAEHHLVVVGARGWLDEALVGLLRSSTLAERIHVTGRVPDHDLVGLYRGAECFVFPSRYEGFGFPPLEAMACGAPVVSSDRTSLPEVVGDAAVLVDPDDSVALEHALGEVLGSASRRTELSARGLERAALFTWRRCAELCVAAYRRALAARD